MSLLIDKGPCLSRDASSDTLQPLSNKPSDTLSRTTPKIPLIHPLSHITLSHIPSNTPSNTRPNPLMPTLPYIHDSLYR